jgi:3-methyladenine DNA glycosylase/8-oxoguanine DNA glycosylase
MTAARRALIAKDPVLGRHIEKVGPYRLKIDGISSVYESLAQSIVYQQLNGKAASSIFSRVVALGKNGFPSPDELLSLDDTKLRGAGLSGAKMRAMRDLAEKERAGLLPAVDDAHGLDDGALIEKLTSVRGIGPWTVEMLMIFRLGRKDVLPATDYGVRQGFQKVFRTKDLPTPKQILARGERWRPHRTMAAWYLWRALDTPGARS